MAYSMPCAFEFLKHTAAGDPKTCSVLIRTYPYLSVLALPPPCALHNVQCQQKETQSPR